MKKDNIELRKNGDKILRKTYDSGHQMYTVFIKEEEGTFRKSKNGPWDYLYNARRESDRRLIRGKKHV